MRKSPPALEAFSCLSPSQAVGNGNAVQLKEREPRCRCPTAVEMYLRADTLCHALLSLWMQRPSLSATEYRPHPSANSLLYAYCPFLSLEE